MLQAFTIHFTASFVYVLVTLDHSVHSNSNDHKMMKFSGHFEGLLTPLSHGHPDPGSNPGLTQIDPVMFTKAFLWLMMSQPG